MLGRHGLKGSMGGVASAGDNAAVESFFPLLQHNVLSTGTWAGHEGLTIAVIAWIKHRYHRRGRQRSLERVTPIECETINN
ncbi:hypothetical protein JIM95_007355 [Corynebacterium sp. CCM 8835]|nr:hypothetical protein [Corynebacterium antarcticum]MCL0245954.1 hypothetical protein [Corynebacterium antarcticum]